LPRRSLPAKAGVRGRSLLCGSSFSSRTELTLVVGTCLLHHPAMSTVSRARRLRREMPDAQRRFWRLLRDRRFAGYKFRREHPFGRYFLDFYCAEAALNIELDGSQHGFPEQQGRDAVKERYLRTRGILTVRYWNWQILREPGAVKEDLWRNLQQRAPHPGNVPTTPNARSRTWPGHRTTEPVPLRRLRRPPRVDEPKDSQGERGARGDTRFEDGVISYGCSGTISRP
jgi:very-short-patch-repair endonuclease